MEFNFGSDSEALLDEHADFSYYIVSNDDQSKKFICKFLDCGKAFRYKSEIQRHIVAHSKSRPFICQYNKCLKTFKRIDALECHNRYCHINKKTFFTCTYLDCKKPFTTKERLDRHLEKCHGQIASESLSPEQLGTSELRKQVGLGTLVEKSIHYYQSNKKVDLMHQVTLGSDLFTSAIANYIKTLQGQILNADTSKTLERLKQAVEYNKVLNKEVTMVARGILSDVQSAKEAELEISGLHVSTFKKDDFILDSILKKEEEECLTNFASTIDPQREHTRIK